MWFTVSIAVIMVVPDPTIVARPPFGLMVATLESDEDQCTISVVSKVPELSPNVSCASYCTVDMVPGAPTVVAGDTTIVDSVDPFPPQLTKPIDKTISNTPIGAHNLNFFITLYSLTSFIVAGKKAIVLSLGTKLLSLGRLSHESNTCSCTSF